MLGAPMLRQRAAAMAPRGISYCVVLPQCGGGVKVGFGRIAASEIETPNTGSFQEPSESSGKLSG
jgi:hypothetical protein